MRTRNQETASGVKGLLSVVFRSRKEKSIGRLNRKRKVGGSLELFHRSSQDFHIDFIIDRVLQIEVPETI